MPRADSVAAIKAVWMEGYRYARRETRDAIGQKVATLRAEASRRWALVSQEPALPHAYLAAELEHDAAALEQFAATLAHDTSDTHRNI